MGLTLVGLPSTSHAESAASRGPTAVAAAQRTVTLPTGDRVTVNTVGGRTTYAMTATPGGSDAFEKFQVGAEHHVIPAEVTPYLGRQLDKSPSDVTQLSAGDGARGPVQMSFAAGVTPTAPPGVPLTSVLRTDVHAGRGVRGAAAGTTGSTAATDLPPGFGPADLKSAYDLPSAGGTGQTVAIVDVGDSATSAHPAGPVPSEQGREGRASGCG
jgi:hypothetical protein